jgi:acyl-CoA dehydrogenase
VARVSAVERLLDHLLTSEPAAITAADFSAWWSLSKARGDAWEASLDAALARAFAADRLGYAFAAGYHGALRMLVRSHTRDHLVALCATEARGNRPRHIEARLARTAQGEVVSGKKRFATLAMLAEELLVVASEGTDEAGRNRLRIARVSARAPGVTITAMPATPFAPEIPHAEIALERAPVIELLPGDGYDRYLKPFRTVEDSVVHAALLAYLLGVARRSQWPHAALERLSLELVAAHTIASRDPASVATHVALAGLIETTRALIADLAPHWERVGPVERDRWQRDQGLFTVAGRARDARRERAWERIAQIQRDARG